MMMNIPVSDTSMPVTQLDTSITLKNTPSSDHMTLKNAVSHTSDQSFRQKEDEMSRSMHGGDFPQDSISRQEEVSQSANLDRSELPIISQSQKSEFCAQNEDPTVGNHKTLLNHNEAELAQIPSMIGVQESQWYNESKKAHHCVMNLSEHQFYLGGAKFFIPFSKVDNSEENRNKIGQKSQIQQKASLTQQTVPLIKEWFSQFGIQDRQVLLSIIDSQLIQTIKDMYSLICSSGPGVFRMVVKTSDKDGQAHSLCNTDNLLQQNFEFLPFSQQGPEFHGSLQGQSKLLVEKELLEYIRLTTTCKDSMATLQGSYMLPKSLNTLTAAQPLLLKRSEESNTLVSTSLPEWLSVKEGFSLAQLIIFIWEVSVHAHFQSCQSSTLSEEDSQFVSPVGHLIDSNHFIKSIWQDIKSKTTLVNAILKKIQEMSQDAGDNENLHLFKTLMMNQSSFIQDICLTSLQKSNSTYFTLERAFIETILKFESQKEQFQVKTLKNQKKKSKRKLKKLEIRTYQLMRDEVMKMIDDVMRTVDRSEEDKEDINDTDRYDTQYHRTESDCLEQVLSEFNFLQLLELNHPDFKDNYDGNEDHLNREPMSVFSESTEDIMENFSSHLQDLKSPQASINTEFENELRNNLYSSEAGDSSIQLQKQYSDYNKEIISQQNERMYSSFKKQSLDSIDIQASIDRSKYEDQSFKNSTSRNPMDFQQSPYLNESNFQIIKPGLGFFQEQQFENRAKQNKRKKKRGRGQGIRNAPDSAAKLNQFMRNINQCDEEEDYYDEDYAYQRKEQIKVQDVQHLVQSPVKTAQTPSKIELKPIYVKKMKEARAQFSAEEVKESVTSFMDTPKEQRAETHSSAMSTFSQESQLKKKSFTKGKKAWEGKGKKKSGKSKGGLSMSKQASYDQTPLDPYSLQLSRGYSHMPQYQSPDFGFDGPELNLDYLKLLIQQNIIQQSLLTSQCQLAQSPVINLGHYDENPECEMIPEEGVESDPEQKAQEAFFEMVSNQINQFQKANEGKLDSVRKERLEATKIIENLVSQSYHYYKKSYVTVKSYGSMASNLAIDSSDVDLAVVGLDFGGKRDTMIHEMRKLYEQIELIVTSKESLQFIDTATVPVIKLVIDLVKVAKQIERQEKSEYGFNHVKRNHIDESMRYLGIDITFEDTFKKGYTYDGIPRMSFGQDCSTYIKELCMRQPHLKPIVVILKKLLQNYDLNQTYSGGLNSYSLVLMTSAFLSLNPGIDILSQNLFETFHYYGYYFDPKMNIIALGQTPAFIKAVSSLEEHMTIIDPLNSLNNTARGAFKIDRILEIFKQAYDFLMNCLAQYKVSQVEIDVIQLLLNIQSQQELH